jgi:hypothetical protein
MLGLGLASSSVAPLFLPQEQWAAAYESTTPNLQPFFNEDDSLQTVQQYIGRVQAAFGVLREQVERYKPSTLVLVAPNAGVEVTPLVPTFHLSAGSFSSGAGPDKQSAAGPAQGLLTSLVQRGFDLCQDGASGQQPISPNILQLLNQLNLDRDVVIVPLLVNTQRSPLPTARRCWELGLAIGEVLRSSSEKVAILAAGGMSHDVAGRWIDEPFDRAVLDALTERSERLKKLFTFDSENLRGPTGEIRLWLVAAAACSSQMQLFDYFPARQAKTGLAFAYWRETE